MKLEDQVCSLELAKRLKELGVNKRSLFYWIKGKNCKFAEKRLFCIIYSDFFSNLDDTDSLNNYEYYSAFTVAELGEILPGNIPYEDTTARLEFIKAEKWLLAYVVSNDEPPLICITEDTEANARARMLRYLLEHGVIDDTKIYIPDNAFDLVMGAKK